MVRAAYTYPEESLVFFASSVESRALAAADPDMALLIERVGEVMVDIEGDGFISIARAIVDQQISMAAARTIWSRFETLCGGGPLTPETVLAHDIEALRTAGLSRSKASYILDLAQRVADGSLDFTLLEAMPDDEVIAELTRVRGVGRWTAEMFLMFSLRRPDVFALDDGGLRRAVCALKGLDADTPKVVLEDISSAWEPYRTCASLYLWRGLGQGVLQSL